MQAVGNGYKGFGLVMRLGADRVVVFAAIVISLAVAANIGLQLTVDQIPPSFSFY